MALNDRERAEVEQAAGLVGQLMDAETAYVLEPVVQGRAALLSRALSRRDQLQQVLIVLNRLARDGGRPGPAPVPSPPAKAE